MFWNKKRDALFGFLRNSEPDSSISGFRELFFKRVAHEILSVGGKFDCRNIEGGRSFTIEITKRTKDRFLFHMTTSDHPPLNKKRITETLHERKLEALHFVVPRSVYEDFKTQRLDESESKSTGAETKKRKQRDESFNQYVIAIDLDTSTNFCSKCRSEI
jgi:hypothetical protein